MNRIEGQKEFQVRLLPVEQSNKKQHWEIQDYQSGQALQASRDYDYQNDSSNSDE